MSANETVWQALDVLIEPQSREAIEYALMEAGALGIEEGNEANGLLTVTAYFDSIPEREKIRDELSNALRIYNLPSSSARDMTLREIENKDWLGEWKANWKPVTVGERFIIAPPWSEIEESDKIIIRIEPGMAFGTGTHETTKLCLDAIEKHFDGGSFSDVGTGTGILAIAAAKLFPSSEIKACDTDAEAIEIARENAILNETPQINFSVGSIDEQTASTDFVCANLTADVIVPMLHLLIGATCGRLVLSGILETQEEWVTSRLRHELGVNQFQIEHDGEWIAIIL